MTYHQWAEEILACDTDAECYAVLRSAMSHYDPKAWTSLEVRNAFWEIDGYKAWFYDEARKRGGDVITENYMIAVLTSGNRILKAQQEQAAE